MSKKNLLFFSGAIHLQISRESHVGDIILDLLGVKGA